MRHVDVGLALSVAVASATFLGCDTCTESKLLVEDTLEVTPTAACAFLTSQRGGRTGLSEGNICAQVCGKSVYNNCIVMDTTYPGAYAFANPNPDPAPGSDAGTRPVLCPEHAGTVQVRCSVYEDQEVLQMGGCVVAGRRPTGLVPGRAAFAIAGDNAALGAYFARGAHLEAASVLAFDDLAKELWLLGAPDALVARAHAAARDEVVHADLVGNLAGRFGAMVPEVCVMPSRAPRTLLDVAVDNMVEGIVRETYAAAVEIHRAGAAVDPEVREVLGIIARDEVRHAQLSWDIGTWIHGRLNAAEQSFVRAAASRAMADLRGELSGVPAEVSRVAGVPSEETARALFGAVEAQLWGKLAAAA